MMEEPVTIRKSSMEQHVEVFQEIIVLGRMKNGVLNLVENILVEPLGNEQVMLSFGAKKVMIGKIFIGVMKKAYFGTIQL